MGVGLLLLSFHKKIIQIIQIYIPPKLYGGGICEASPIPEVHPLAIRFVQSFVTRFNQFIKRDLTTFPKHPVYCFVS